MAYIVLRGDWERNYVISEDVRFGLCAAVVNKTYTWIDVTKPRVGLQCWLTFEDWLTYLGERPARASGTASLTLNRWFVARWTRRDRRRTQTLRGQWRNTLTHSLLDARPVARSWSHADVFWRVDLCWELNRGLTVCGWHERRRMTACVMTKLISTPARR